MTATVAEKPQLDYAPTVPWRRRRLVRSLFWVLLLVVLAGTFYFAYPRVREQLQVLEWQRRCIAAPVPPDTLVFEEREWGTNYLIGGVPSAWTTLYAAISPPGLQSQSTVFLREMRNPAGKRRLVAVDIDRTRMWRPTQGPYVINLSARVVRPGAGMIRPAVVSTTNHSLQTPGARQKMRIYAGAQDPADPSHFTFTYDIGGRVQVVDGWLGNDDTVTIEPRLEPVVTPLPPASPASLPTSVGSGRRGWPFRVSRSSAPPASRPASSR